MKLHKDNFAEAGLSAAKRAAAKVHAHAHRTQTPIPIWENGQVVMVIPDFPSELLEKTADQ